MSLDYRLLWFILMLFIPFCANNKAGELKNELLCVSINNNDLTGQICSLRVVLDSAIIKAETKQKNRTNKIEAVSASSPVYQK